MKKSILFGFAACALLLTACDDYKEPNPAPQTNPQESILKTDAVEVADALDAEANYSLPTLDAAGEKICVATVNVADLPAGYDLAAVAEISSNGFAKATPVEASVVKTDVDGIYNVLVAPDALQGAYVEGISKGPKAKDIEIRFLLETVAGGQVAVVGGPQNYYGPFKFNVTPFPSELVIEDAYYLLGSINGWDVATAVKFNHSGKDVYDDPVFTLKFEVSAAQAADGWWWKIIPASCYALGEWGDADDSQFGPAENGDESATGMLVGRKDGENPGAGCWKEEGQWLMTINMEEMTYEISSAVDFLYTPGDANGWSQINSQVLYTNDYANYEGYALLSPNGFKFCNAPDWNHINYGVGAEAGKIDPAGGNLSVAEAGLYWCKVNTASLDYSVTLISTYGVIGDATEGGWDASTALSTIDNLVWTGEIKLKGSGAFKFRANNGWDINLGGNLQDLTPGGSDIPSPGEGTYVVTLNLGTYPYSATLVKK